MAPTNQGTSRARDPHDPGERCARDPGERCARDPGDPDERCARDLHEHDPVERCACDPGERCVRAPRGLRDPGDPDERCALDRFYSCRQGRGSLPLQRSFRVCRWLSRTIMGTMGSVGRRTHGRNGFSARCFTELLSGRGRPEKVNGRGNQGGRRGHPNELLQALALRSVPGVHSSFLRGSGVRMLACAGSGSCLTRGRVWMSYSSQSGV